MIQVLRVHRGQTREARLRKVQLRTSQNYCVAPRFNLALSIYMPVTVISILYTYQLTTAWWDKERDLEELVSRAILARSSFSVHSSGFHNRLLQDLHVLSYLEALQTQFFGVFVTQTWLIPCHWWWIYLSAALPSSDDSRWNWKLLVSYRASVFPGTSCHSEATPGLRATNILISLNKARFSLSRLGSF